MTMGPRIILGSGSAIRAKVLRAAGLDFEQVKPAVDEDDIKRECRGADQDLEQTAMALAEAKALAIPTDDEALVIGADQILEYGGAAFDKPTSLAEARARLLEMQGDAHTLINAVAVAQRGAVVWRHLDRPRLSMRKMDAAEIDAYLAAAGEDILSSVGAYQVEKFGSRLFSRIDGDHFAVLGLSLYPLFDFLRQEGALAF